MSDQVSNWDVQTASDDGCRQTVLICKQPVKVGSR